MSCSGEYLNEKRIRVKSESTSPHRLALAKARARYNLYADRRTRELHDEVRQWTRDFECPGNCVKGGTMVISSHRIYREWESPDEKRAIVRGVMEIKGIVKCHEPAYASLLEEGTDDLMVEVDDETNFKPVKV